MKIGTREWLMSLLPREWRKRKQHARRSEAAKKAWRTRKSKAIHAAVLAHDPQSYQQYKHIREEAKTTIGGQEETMKTVSKSAIVLLLALVAMPAFGQFRMKDNTATVLYGGGGMLRTCVWDNYGNPVNGAQVYAYTDFPAVDSGFHYHSALGRPNITFDGGLSTAGPKSTAGGCVSFHVTMPQFAGQYYVTAYCTTCLNQSLSTFNVRAAVAPFQPFPSAGWTGIQPLWPAVGSSHISGDGFHGNVHHYGTPSFVSKMETLGTYYSLIGYPNVTASSKLIMIRMSIPLGGWLDDESSLWWYPVNFDPHADGIGADFYRPGTTFLQNAFRQASTSAGCLVSTEPDPIYTDAGPMSSAVWWHVSC